MRAQNDQPTRSEVADEQFNVADEVKQASSEISRAARHQERLNNDQAQI